MTTGEEADQKWLDKDGNLSDTKVELTLKDFDHEKGTKEYTLGFEGIQIGEYTVKETTKDIDGKDVTVSYQLNDEEAQTGDSATGEVKKNETTTVAFEDDYTNQTETQTGNLQLTKTIKGDITEEEAEGALTFEVTTADGKWLKADGNLSDTKVELTLKDFDHEDGTKEYTLSFEGIQIGDYTVTETTKTIDGKDVAVSYTIDNGQKQTGTSAEATVKEGKDYSCRVRG